MCVVECGSTTEHMFILKCMIIEEYCQSKGNGVYACFVGFQKDFDTVTSIHTGLKSR